MSSLFFAELCRVLSRPDVVAGVDAMVGDLAMVRDRGGRVFCIGVGGGAANAAHAVNDLRKLCGIEAYAPSDGISELTARANDEGWGTIFTGWLKVSKLSQRDALLIFSVGGGTATVSNCIQDAVTAAREVGARILGIVGRAYPVSVGAVAVHGHAVVYADPTGRVYAANELLTPVTETLQAAVLHALVSDPRLKTGETKW